VAGPNCCFFKSVPELGAEWIRDTHVSNDTVVEERRFPTNRSVDDLVWRNSGSGGKIFPEATDGAQTE
jgi:hypothetical protein